VAQFKYLGTTITNQNLIQEEIELGQCLLQFSTELLFSHLLSKNVKIRIYKSIILPVVLYGCETWSPTLREEHRLRMFQNRVLRRIFGSKRNELTGGWRNLHDEELCNLYSSPGIIRMIKSSNMRWAGHVARMGAKKNAYRTLVSKPEGKRPLRKQRVGGWITLNWILRELGCGGMDWIDLAQDGDQWRAPVNEVMNLRIS
jgi:hypothetical protein